MKLIYLKNLNLGDIKGGFMNNLVIVMDKKPSQSDNTRTEEWIRRAQRSEFISTQGTLTRIIDKFENTNPIQQTGVIKDYIYVEQKRILA